MSEVRIATRGSALARAQAARVAAMIQAARPGATTRLVAVETTGDRDQTGSIVDLTEIGAFVRAIQDAVLEGRADLAVHSLKDLPVASAPDLEIVAFPERRQPWDVMVGATVATLLEGALVGTGSPRRAAQLEVLRPDIKTVPLRGNVDTRLRKIAAGEVDAAVLAEAGLARLGRSEVIAQRFDVSEMVPAPGQGVLAVEALVGSEAADIGRLIDDLALRQLVSTERLLLETTGAGCRSALGALATPDGARIRLDAFVDDERGPRRSLTVADTPEEAVTATRAELGL